MDYELYSLIVDKKGAPEFVKKNPAVLYTVLASQLVAIIPNQTSVLHVELDRTNSAEDRKHLDENIEHEIKDRYRNMSVYTYHMDSQESRGVQAADIFSWILFAKYEHGQDHLYAAIEPKTREIMIKLSDWKL